MDSQEKQNNQEKVMEVIQEEIVVVQNQKQEESPNEVVEEKTIEIKDEVVEKKEKKEETNDRHEQVNPYKDGLPYKELKDNEMGGSIIIPVATYKKIMDFVEKVDKLDDNYIDTEYTEDQKDSTRLDGFSIRYTNKNNVMVDNLNKSLDNYINKVNYGDKKLNMTPLTLSVENTKKLSPSQATLMFRTLLSVGEAIQVPLWHSGFWINLKPPTQADIINLQVALTNSEVELGRNTNTLIYSNYAVVFNRIITDFIIKHIDDTTLIVPEGGNIRDYILVHDYYPLVLGILTTMYPKGINVLKSCINSTILDEENKPKCNFIVSANMDPKKILWVDRTALSDKMLTHMGNRIERTMSVDSVKEYQLSISRLIDKDYELESSNGNKFKIKFSLPTLTNYITNGERWVNNIIKKAELLFTNVDTKEQRNTKINDLALSGVLGIYNVFVKEIFVGDIGVTDYEAIMDMLSTISSDDKAFLGFITKIEEFITTSALAIVATPSYTCPTCNKHQTEGKKGRFKEFIPFNIVEHFFVLCALRAEKTQTRTI